MILLHWLPNNKHHTVHDGMHEIIVAGKKLHWDATFFSCVGEDVTGTYHMVFIAWTIYMYPASFQPIILRLSWL